MGTTSPSLSEKDLYYWFYLSCDEWSAPLESELEKYDERSC